jgi:hypothetical protein
MRIAWATPFNPTSAVACNFSLPVARELIRQGHEVEIVRTEIRRATKLPALPVEAPVYFSRAFAERLQWISFDAVIVNWGDDLLQHGGALAMAAARPTVAIFHDAEMKGFVAAAARLYKRTRAYFTMSLPAGYRSDGLEPDRAEELAWFATLAFSAIAHHRQCLPAVQAACPGPVRLVSPDVSVPAGPNRLRDGDASSDGMTSEFPSPLEKAYVDILLSLVDAAVAPRPVPNVGLQYGTIFDAWGAGYDEPAIARIGAAMDELFGAVCGSGNAKERNVKE